MRALLLVAGALIVAGCSRGDVMKPPESQVADSIVVTSPAFADGRSIPREYTCKGAGGSPEVAWRGVPGDAKSLALVVSDPDAPRGTFIHWVLYDLPPRDGRLAAGAPPPAAREAANSGGKEGWYPPCPPSGTHRYVFTVYALSDRPGGRSTQDILDEIGRVAVARGTLTGLVAAS
ncbi:MAG TPA: YbhB/YbcL family Raf kinase inhibitor-like protein [Actinoplanes sp.]|nr:YbhB/YbcL family Raf kinase inhibitor-like protein [Actinoplanes sp.]